MFKKGEQRTLAVSCVTEEEQECKSLHWQANCKNLVRTYLIKWHSAGCSFFATYGVFSSDFGFWYKHPHPDSPSCLNFFLSVGWWAPFG